MHHEIQILMYRILCKINIKDSIAGYFANKLWKSLYKEDVILKTGENTLFLKMVKFHFLYSLFSFKLGLHLYRFFIVMFLSCACVCLFVCLFVRSFVHSCVCVGARARVCVSVCVSMIIYKMKLGTSP